MTKSHHTPAVFSAMKKEEQNNTCCPLTHMLCSRCLFTEAVSPQGSCRHSLSAPLSTFRCLHEGIQFHNICHITLGTISRPVLGLDMDNENVQIHLLLILDSFYQLLFHLISISFFNQKTSKKSNGCRKQHLFQVMNYRSCWVKLSARNNSLSILCMNILKIPPNLERYY